MGSLREDSGRAAKYFQKSHGHASRQTQHKDIQRNTRRLYKGIWNPVLYYQCKEDCPYDVGPKSVQQGDLWPASLDSLQSVAFAVTSWETTTEREAHCTKPGPTSSRKGDKETCNSQRAAPQKSTALLGHHKLSSTVDRSKVPQALLGAAFTGASSVATKCHEYLSNKCNRVANHYIQRYVCSWR